MSACLPKSEELLEVSSMFTLWEIWEKIHLFRESSKRRFCRGKQVNVVERKLIDDSQIV
jgi:hypothetical protein